jgi:hypothetical protein
VGAAAYAAIRHAAFLVCPAVSPFCFCMPSCIVRTVFALRGEGDASHS